MASWKKVIVSGSAADLSSLTLGNALAIAEGGTAATTAAGARTTLGLGTAATRADSYFATGAEGDLATGALPKSGGAMTGAITTNSTFDGRDVATDGTKLDGIESSATADQTAAQMRTAIGTGNGNLVPAAGTAGHFLKHDGSFGIPAYTTNTTSSIASIVAAVEAGTDSNTFTDADHSKLNAIEASADVTDATNVAAAGALMDSECTDLAAVKATEDPFTAALLSKLNAIEASATADQSNAEIVAAVEAGTDSNTFTDADHTKLNAIEASADVTDTANVTSAGALMDSECTNLAAVKAFTGEAAATADQTNAEIRTAVEAATDSNAFTDSDHTKLNAIEAAADVTDTANVTSAGALMDSECTNLAAVKAFTGEAAATADQTGVEIIDLLGGDLGANFGIGSTSDDTCTFAGPVIVSGDLTVNGTTTTVATTNLSIQDQFVTIASGSTSATDGGIIVSKQASGAGFGLGYDTATTRWVLDDDLAVDATGITADVYLATVEKSTAVPSSAPGYGGSSYGHGTIHVETDTGDIYIYS